MFERFSDQARQVVVLAADIARAHHHDFLGTEHLLAGILDGGGPAAAALTAWGVTAPAIRGKLDTARTGTRSDPHRPLTHQHQRDA
ncbi:MULTISPECIES: Clp protease N-terminal domain-containing protein [unclassified Rhodococcus (in: high G+C Gram-positive bacteria)]|jgi:ATP-dependent Clp protease ATP-binding subunit ClpC|uniref:Clp protease N-terminal domain-containing protein n=1 Tax=unclassified Rhodococcus (in: high G+C Gram-positive bacteria) TaxID=192944 RepID=UPI00049600E4|nr:Clp protease N-terminal domain-containing protein [Rhodococcus sp. DK17]